MDRPDSEQERIDHPEVAPQLRVDNSGGPIE
jgi:hypothetical protein